ncbi:MAG: trehalose/maltose transport system substrate-binding protein [bacterium]
MTDNGRRLRGVTADAPPSEPMTARPGASDAGRAKRRIRPLGIVLAIGACLVVAGLLVKWLAPHDSSAVVQKGWASAEPHGAIRYCTGEDVAHTLQRSANDFNRSFPGATVSVDEGSFITDTNRKEYLDAIANGTNDCDVIFLDVIYMKEFASKHLLYDMSPYLTPGLSATFNDKMMETTEQDGKRWGVPKQLDVGVMYYRGDRVDAPRTWQDVYRIAQHNGDGRLPGLRLPIGSYEGVTVVLLELAYAAGAQGIVSDDGRHANLDQPQVLEALRFLRDARRDGVTPALKRQTDTANVEVYEEGRADFLRGWPFVAAALPRDAAKGRTETLRAKRREIARQTKIAPLPTWGGNGRSVSILGGHDLVIPKSSHNPAGAMRLVAFLTSATQVRKDLRTGSQYPVLNDVANDLGATHGSLIEAVQKTTIIPRPTLVGYAAISKIIAAGVKAATEHPRDDAFTRRALQRIQRDVQHALDAQR